ncbi:unnamed protein product [Adineta steineri]|uniref:Uncharacterized protein n=1 Tax=Adineta steineri TaxID=433720 RepID=A0A814FIC0_9BILA|nr:unnamed protein product [Adineta steineri]CAF1388068.1 unnamed protein product [Adineta steineri]CAF3482605.1 unnamed protein product [Adineta steineri]CAF3903359.1 unnamed protein product [Adineta steineri]
MSNSNRDPFFDDGEVGTEVQQQEEEEVQQPPIPAARRRSSSDIEPTEIIQDPIEIPRPRSLSPIPETPLVLQPEVINEEIHESKHSSRQSSLSIPFESDIDDEEEESKEKPQEKEKSIIVTHSTVDVDIQTDPVTKQDESIQTETIHNESLSKISTRKIAFLSESQDLTTPLVKTLFDRTILSALPIISFCQPFSMTSHVNDIILAMPRHLMIIHNQNSISVYPWQQPHESISTILECFWCSFLYKLLVTTIEDNRLYIYDFVSIIDSIKLRGYPLSIKYQSYKSQQTTTSSSLLPPSSRHQPLPAVWSQTRFTKSNSLGIYYCYISDRHYSCMLTRIDHNTRQHVKAIDCSGGSLNNQARICAMGLSDDRVAIVLTNLIMTLYNAETLIGLKQINLARWNNYGIRGISTLIYLWKTWLIFDPIDNKVVGVAKRKRQFVRMLPEQPINACSMDNGTLALWMGYPGALVYYRLVDEK